MILIDEMRLVDSHNIVLGDAFLSQKLECFLMVSQGNRKMHFSLTGKTPFLAKEVRSEKVMSFGKTEIHVDPLSARWSTHGNENEAVPAGALVIFDGDLLVFPRKEEKSLTHFKLRNSTQKLESNLALYFTKWKVTQSGIVLAEIDVPLEFREEKSHDNE